MDYLGPGDLVKRWVYTRQGIHRLIKSTGFPTPAFHINAGRVPVWQACDIEAWEREHPEVTSETAKLQKQIGYFRAVSRG
jgi:hypothetical protein